MMVLGSLQQFGSSPVFMAVPRFLRAWAYMWSFGDGDDKGGDCIGIGETCGDGCIVTGDPFGDECIVTGVSGTGMLCGGVITPLNSRLKSNDELVADGGCINDAT